MSITLNTVTYRRQEHTLVSGITFKFPTISSFPGGCPPWDPWLLLILYTCQYSCTVNIIQQQAKYQLTFLRGSYSRRCRLRWTTSGGNSEARLSTPTVVDSSLTAWQLDDNSDSWRLQRSLSREWLSICRQTRCHVSSRQLSTICFSTSRAAVRSSMNRWYCCSTCEQELPNISCTTQTTAFR